MKYWRKPFDLEEKATKPPRVLIDEARCKGCAYCVEFCPRGVLRMSTELSQKGYTLAEVEDEGKCLGCGLCSVLCPEFAIELSPSNTEEN
jgi:2-oxoglutarate ferredoxin oxidoreductase subunit delta